MALLVLFLAGALFLPVLVIFTPVLVALLAASAGGKHEAAPAHRKPMPSKNGAAQGAAAAREQS